MSESESEAQGPKFAIQRIYLKDVSFESPGAPESFRSAPKPSVNLDLNARHVMIEEKLWEVILSLTLTAKDESDKTLYLAEVQQAGIFLVDGMTDEGLDQMLASFCPSILFPYARESVDTLIVKGSFPPLMLAPVNFDALYEQAKLAKERDAATVQ
jgi:preprotein translocase subunit SecB